jgi:hypothetical protein
LIFLLVCFGLGILVRACDSGPSYSRYTPPPRIEVPKFRPASIPSIDLSKIRDLTQAPEPLWLRMLCPEGAEEATEKCATAEILYEALEAKQCGQAAEAWRGLVRLSSGDPVVKLNLSGIERSIRQACPTTQ